MRNFWRQRGTTLGLCYNEAHEVQTIPTNWSTNTMEQGPSWEANSLSANQEISYLLWNLKIHYPVHNRPPLVPIWATLTQFTPSHSTSVWSILILSSYLYLGLPSGLFHSIFWPKFCMYFSSLVCARCPAHLILLDLITLIIFSKAYKLQRSYTDYPTSNLYFDAYTDLH